MNVRRVAALILAGILPLGMTVAITATAPGAQAADPLRVLIVGDSVTQGSAGDWTWRYRLWQEFQRQDVPVDFVGPRNDLYDNVTNRHGSQAYLDPAFDRDHAAKWGAAFDWQERRIDELTAEYAPDVVVVMLGVINLTFFNQQPGETRDALRRFVESARTADPGVDVVLGTVPQTWVRASVAPFNAMVDDVSQELPGTAVAQTHIGFVQGVDTWDGAHASASGEVKLAGAATDALAELGHLEPARRPLPSVTNGPRIAPTFTATRVGSAARLRWVLPPGATAARVWKRSTRGPWSRVGDDVTGTSTLRVPLARGTRTYFKVQPVKGVLAAAADAHSVVAYVAPPVVQPTAQAPRAVRVRKAGKRVVVSWAPGTNATRHRILIRTAGKWRAMGWAVGTRWRSQALKPGRRYAVRVQSYHGTKAGKVSAVRSVRP